MPCYWPACAAIRARIVFSQIRNPNGHTIFRYAPVTRSQWASLAGRAKTRLKRRAIVPNMQRAFASSSHSLAGGRRNRTRSYALQGSRSHDSTPG